MQVSFLNMHLSNMLINKFTVQTQRDKINSSTVVCISCQGLDVILIYDRYCMSWYERLWPALASFGQLVLQL